MTEQLKANWKKLLSYTKSTWDIDDYPLRYKKQFDEKGEHKEDGLKLWVVQIINWWTMTGLGDTKEEAYLMLKNNFKGYLKLYSVGPRPGSKAPLLFADTNQIDKLEEVAVDFFDKILDYDYYECLITDESSLTDFGKDDLETLALINSTYNLALTEIGDGNIARLLSLIDERRQN